MNEDKVSGIPLSKERDLLLQALRWLKRERLENTALRSALQISAHVYAEATNTILQEKSVQMEKCEKVVSVEFRQAETELIDQQSDLSALESLLAKHQQQR